MPIASWSDIVDTSDTVDEAEPQRASFADIESIVSPPSTAAPRRATFGDIAAILPPAPAFSPLEQDVIAGSPATQAREAQGFSLAPAQPTVEPPAGPSLMDAVRKSAPGRFVDGAAVPVTGIIRGGMALGKTAADQIREGGLAAVPGAIGGVVTGAARSVVEPAVSAIVPPLMQRKPGEATLGAVDQVIPLRDIAHRVQSGDYAGAAGEVLSTAALIAGPHAAERLRGGSAEEVPHAEAPVVVQSEAQPETPPAPADVPPAGPPVPETVAPPPAAVAPPPNVAHVSDIVDVVEPGVVPNEGVKPAPPVLEPDAQAVRDQTAPPATAHVSDIAEVVEPAPAAQVAHVNDITEVLEPAAQTSAEISAPGAAESGKVEESHVAGPETPVAGPEAPVAAAGAVAPDGLEERPDAAGEGLPAEGRDSARDAPRRSDAEFEHDALRALVDDAVARGHTGDPEPLHRELADRLQLIKELDAEFADSGHNPEALLREIARLGGFSIKEETALKGELAWLKEHQDNFGSAERPRGAFGMVRGVKGVFSERVGHSVDHILEGVRQDPRFEHIGTIDDLLEEVRAAATAEHPRAAIERLKRGLGERWWERVGHGHEEDLSFDPEQLEAESRRYNDAHGEPPDDGAAEVPAAAAGAEADAGGHGRVQPDAAPGRHAEEPAAEVVDRLDTGEDQRRLPGAAEARQAGKADTSFRAPAQASGDDFNLETPLTDEQKAADAREAAGPSMFDEPLASPRRDGKPVVTIREKTWDDTGLPAAHQRGTTFSVAWSDGDGGFPRRIVVRDRATAERVRAAVQDGVRGEALDAIAFPKTNDDFTLSMPDRRKRADTSGALVPSPAARAVSLLARGEKQLRPSEIVRDLSKSLDELPIRVGKFTQHALGIYKPKEQTIRLKVANDLDTLAHEFGHHIHESLLGTELPPKGYRDELEALGLPTSRSSYSLKQKLAEGQAEFTRLFLSDPPAAQKAAPIYYQAFETALESHPELAAVLARAQRQYTGHLSLDPVARGLSHLDFDGVDPHTKTDIVTRLQTAWVDDLYPMRAMVEDLADHQPIDYTKNGYILARLARGASAKAAGFLEHGVRAGDGTFIAPALAPALKPVKGQIREFAGYLAALRALELRGRGMETGMSRVEAQAIVTKFKSPAFDTARDGVYAYQDGLLVYATHAGTLSVDQLKAIKELNKAYVPFQRVIDDVGAAASQGKGGIANRAIPVKRIKGSGRDVINPLESIVKNTHTLVSMVEQNRAMRALVDQVQSTTGGGRYLEAIPEKLVPTSFNLSVLEKEIREHLADQGVDLEMSDRDMFDKLVTVFTPTQFRMGEKGVVSVLRDGTRKWFQVNDQALYDAIATIGPKSSDLLVNMLMKPARLLRAGATTSVGFIARNPIRDNFEAYVNSRYGYKPGYDFVRGVFELYRHGEDYQAFLNSGAGNSAMVGLDRNRLRQELVNMGAVKRRAFADSVILNPVNLLQALSEAMEHATRIGEFKRGVETEGRTAEGYARAAMAARDVTIDFARGGAVSKEVNRFTAFFNAAVQGNVRLAEVFRQDPYGATARAVTAITVPSMALWAINQDDPTYRELPDWERNTYWHIPLGRGPGHSWARLPKPFSLGMVFGNSVEAALDYMMKKDPEALTRVLPDKQSAWRQAVGVLPTALMPAVEVATNYDTFRDRSIVNAGDVNLDTALQYNRWTSDLAKFVGPKIGIAPAKLDHLIYGYGAGVGAGAAQLVDKGAAALGLVKNQKPAGGLGGLPLVGTFYRETPGADARSLEQFYRLRDRVDGAVGSLRRYEKADDEAAAAARKQQAQTDFAPDAGKTLERVRATDKGLATIRDEVNQVFANPRLEPAEKKELLDRLYEQMVNGARAGLGLSALPSRFPKAAAPALLQKLQRPKPSAPGGRPAAVESRPSALPPPRPASPASPR